MASGVFGIAGRNAPEHVEEESNILIVLVTIRGWLSHLSKLTEHLNHQPVQHFASLRH